jgi:hypothetical protein
MHPPMMDSPDHFSRFRDFRYPDDRNPLSTQNPSSRYTDGSLDLRHVSPQTDGLDRSPDFSHENSRSHVIVTPNFMNTDIPMATPLVGTFASAIPDGKPHVAPVRSDS